MRVLIYLRFVLYFHASDQHVVPRLPAPATFACPPPPHAVSTIMNLALWNRSQNKRFLLLVLVFCHNRTTTVSNPVRSLWNENPGKITHCSVLRNIPRASAEVRNLFFHLPAVLAPYRINSLSRNKAYCENLRPRTQHGALQVTSVFCFPRLHGSC